MYKNLKGSHQLFQITWNGQLINNIILKKALYLLSELLVSSENYVIIATYVTTGRNVIDPLFRIQKRVLPLIVIVSFFLLSLSVFNKTYIPVIRNNSEEGVIESCPEHMKHNPLADFIRDAIGQSDNKDYPEKICFCYHISLSKNLKYFLATLELYDLSLQDYHLKFSGDLHSPNKINFPYNNKAPPFSIS